MKTYLLRISTEEKKTIEKALSLYLKTTLRAMFECSDEENPDGRNTSPEHKAKVAFFTKELQKIDATKCHIERATPDKPKARQLSADLEDLYNLYTEKI